MNEFLVFELDSSGVLRDQNNIAGATATEQPSADAHSIDLAPVPDQIGLGVVMGICLGAVVLGQVFSRNRLHISEDQVLRHSNERPS